MKLCDLHTHVLPGVDDGAATMEYALQMLRNAVASDVEQLAVTPHWMGDGDPMDLQLRFLQLQQSARELPLRLVPGAEVRMCDGLLQTLPHRKLPTINGSRYLLTEFSPDTQSDAFIQALQQILYAGYIPLVAHPERYYAISQNPQQVMTWLDMGCHLQLTGGSILGAYGKTVQRTAEFLLSRDLIACVASDAHGVDRRSNYLLDVYDHLAVWYSKQYARCLMYENPMGICNDNDL